MTKQPNTSSYFPLKTSSSQNLTKNHRGGMRSRKRAGARTPRAASRRARAARRRARSATVWQRPGRPLRSPAGASLRCARGNGGAGSGRRLLAGRGSGGSGWGGWVGFWASEWRCGGLAARGGSGTAAVSSPSPLMLLTERGCGCWLPPPPPPPPILPLRGQPRVVGCGIVRWGFAAFG